MPRDCVCLGDGHPRTCFELRYHGWSPVFLEDDDLAAGLEPEVCQCGCHEDYWEEIYDAESSNVAR